MTGSPEPEVRVAKRRILIVDDHPIIRRGIAQLLADAPDVEVCGGAESVAEALEQLEARRPDLVVVDISLKESHGLDLIAQIKARYGGVKVLVWSAFDEKIFAERALRAGAMGYINKQEPLDKVVAAIRKILGGEVYLSPAMTNALLRTARGPESLHEDPVGRLTDRELEVFQMIGKGMTTQQIARKLDLSPKTVEAHREKIKTKLDLKNASQLTQRAVQWMLENG